jgi:hypothetical protein
MENIGLATPIGVGTPRRFTVRASQGRCLEMILMFNFAEMWGPRPDGSNPHKHINKYPRKNASGF